MISSSSYPQRFHLLLTPIIITTVSGGGNYRTSLIKQCRTLCKQRVRMATRNPLANSQERLLQAKGMVLTNFDGTGVGFGFGIGCGFGVGWGFGGMPMHIWGLGVGGGCGVGLGLGWGFGTGFGSQYRVAKVAFEGINFDNKDPDDKRNPTHSSKNTQDIRASQ